MDIEQLIFNRKHRVTRPAGHHGDGTVQARQLPGAGPPAPPPFPPPGMAPPPPGGPGLGGGPGPGPPQLQGRGS